MICLCTSVSHLLSPRYGMKIALSAQTMRLFNQSSNAYQCYKIEENTVPVLVVGRCRINSVLIRRQSRQT